MPRGQPGSCKVCDHDEADTIRREAILGIMGDVAKKYDIAKNTLDKCIKNHKPEELRQSVGLATVTQNITSHSIIEQKKEEVYSRINKLVTKEGWTEEVELYTLQIEEELNKLRKAGQTHHYTQLSHVKVKLLELAGKSAGVFSPDTAIQINNFIDSEDYKRLKQLIITTLIPYPEALAAVGEAIKHSGL
ncbi:MAG TPA: hypothetical protein PLD02_16730 [Saprospiraceae bacterium]|nr:hypothetical protein [Saprospiraceae bacterium]